MGDGGGGIRQHSERYRQHRIRSDADGVALVAIQGLNAKLEAMVAEQAGEIASLRTQHAAEMDEMRRTLSCWLRALSSSTDMAASR